MVDMAQTLIEVGLKHEQLRDYVREAIVRGDFQPGDRLPSQNELCTQFGVSPGTVREAIGSLVHEGLVCRSQGKGSYVADRTAVGNIAVVCATHQLASPSGHWYHSLATLARNHIEESGFRSLVVTGHGDTDEEFMSSMNLLDEEVVSSTLGVLALSNLGILQSHLSELGVHHVTIELAAAVDRNCVILDYARLTEIAVQELRRHGHHDFALMHSMHPTSRLSGTSSQMGNFVTSLQRSAVGYREDRLITAEYSLDFWDAYRAFKDWWNRPDRPRAIFFYDDSMFDVAGRAIVDLGIKVPEELAIITHANVGRRFHTNIPVVRIGFDAEEVMDAAWGMLDRLIRGERQDEWVYIQPHLMGGESLGPPID
jgi:GntR family transcriptional regulator, arabinose operon transcriptional repressor